MVAELTTLQAAISSTAELVLGHSPNETFQMEVINELVVEFRRLEELCSRLEGPSVRIYDLLLRPLPSQAWWDDRLDAAAERLEADLGALWHVDTELEALRTSAAPIQGLVLGDVDGSSSLAASLYMVAELLEGRIDTAAANGVR
jgi:hypothetical protein